MATVVIDASVVLAWFVPTRTQAEKDFCNGIRTRVFEIGLTIVAPAVFDLEVAGGLLKARRGKLISLARFTEAREACERLPVEDEHDACCISAVNVTEVLTRLIDRGMTAHDAEAAFDALELAVSPFDDAAARACAALRPASRAFGLSIGDRACLALAQAQKLPALTADRAWAQLDCGVVIEQVRPGV